jgi:hypothetical protein
MAPMKAYWFAVLPLLMLIPSARAADEAETVAALKKLGATVIYKDGDPKKGVETLFLPGKKVMDADLKMLANLTQLKTLKLDAASNITDEGVKNLAGLKQLTDLGLAQTKVTDAGLKSMTGLTELKNLALGFDNITDAGLESLAGLKKLENLGLPFTKVTPDGVKKLQQALPNCKIVK